MSFRCGYPCGSRDSDDSSYEPSTWWPQTVLGTEVDGSSTSDDSATSNVTSNSSESTNRNIVGWIIGTSIVLALMLLVCQCIRQRRASKKATMLRDDEALNLPMATPCEAVTVPYASVVDTAATAPDHDDLLPATTPRFAPR
ncbi:hypothetical protein Poli38472_009392 [Pythium oligandrum]|uniref:Uncharacterized protein n=1 Tax=Pythium oligandrum TaxID=41045 RepID=A0A8K1CM99_PYTOL|nr:hypothetical protein Poli38472_009392 [Pythium oligandrum]|eukprot:TMW65225.1 hypothetical protein Poli38472_009392 [Pythium oligandrum]